MGWLRRWGRFIVWYVTHDRNAMHRRAQAAEGQLARLSGKTTMQLQCTSCRRKHLWTKAPVASLPLP